MTIQFNNRPARRGLCHRKAVGCAEQGRAGGRCWTCLSVGLVLHDLSPIGDSSTIWGLGTHSRATESEVPHYFHLLSGQMDFTL